MHASISAKVLSRILAAAVALTPVQNQKARAIALQLEIDKLQERLGPEEDAEKIAKRHIQLLHQYNEAKDAAQILIGRLAAIKQTTIRQIHEDYGLTDDD